MSELQEEIQEEKEYSISYGYRTTNDQIGLGEFTVGSNEDINFIKRMAFNMVLDRLEETYEDNKPDIEDDGDPLTPLDYLESLSVSVKEVTV